MTDLSAEQEAAYVAAIRKAPASREAADARAALLSAHKSRIRHQARRWVRDRHPEDRDDFYSAGVEGYLVALRRFDARQGLRVWTYVKHDVKGAIQQAFYKATLPWAAVNKHVQSELRQMAKAARRLARAGIIEPTADELASEMKETTAHRVRFLRNMSRGATSLTSFVFEDGEESDLLNDEQPEQRPASWSPSWPRPEDVVAQRELREQAETLFLALDARAQAIVRLWAGLGGDGNEYGEAHTPAAIGRQLGISRQAVGAAITRALGRMRDAADARGWLADDLLPGGTQKRPRVPGSGDAAFARHWISMSRRCFDRLTPRLPHRTAFQAPLYLDQERRINDDNGHGGESIPDPSRHESLSRRLA